MKRPAVKSVSSLMTLHLSLKQGLSLNLGLVILLGWLTNTIRESHWLFSRHSSVVIDVHGCAQLPVWVLALSCECGMHFTNSHLLSTVVGFQ